ncbi:hypothetical protein ACFX2I_016506 [Malus domestica]
MQAIIGLESSMQASFVIELGDKAQVPIISFSATSPSFQGSYFFRIAQNDSSQVKAISNIIQAFGWSEAVPISVDNEFGKGVIPYLTTALQSVGARVPYWNSIPSISTDEEIVAELRKLMSMRTRVFIVHMSPYLGSRFFSKAKDFGMMDEGYVWILTNGMTNGFISSSSYVNIDDMQGVVKLDVFGLWAYDAAWALAMAAEKVGITNFRVQKINNSGNSIGSKRLEVSQSGTELVRELSGTRFQGLLGDFSLINKQLQSSTFQVVNVNDNGERGIGYWTPKTGLVRNIKSDKNTSRHSTSNASLGPFIWPEDTTSVPRGWQISANGTLRIGVPVKGAYDELVSVKHDPSTNTTNITGYCIDVFTAVIEVLPYFVPYEFHPFTRPDGTRASYNYLLNQVILGKYDAAVGDITIRGNKSLFVDFTLPYTEAWVSMVVPFKGNTGAKNTWVFLKPLTWDLWATSACFFIFIGYVDDKLKPYHSREELKKLFRNRNKNGGISAAFDETPYMKPFIATYCSECTLVTPTFNSDGFAFVFQKGLLLTRDFSTAITKVSEGGKMEAIEDKWFKKNESCSNSNTMESSNTLSLDSFRGLFIVAGVASSLAILVFTAMFLYEHGHNLTRADSEASFWTRIHEILGVYYGNDLTSDTSKNSTLQNSDHGIAVAESSANSKCPPKSSSSSPDATGPHIVHQELVETPNSSVHGGDRSPNGQATQDSGTHEYGIELTSFPSDEKQT